MKSYKSKTNKNNEMDKQQNDSALLINEFEESISKIQFNQDDVFNNLTFSEISLFLRSSVEELKDEKIGNIIKSISK